jgi:serine/threonine protein kinase
MDSRPVSVFISYAIEDEPLVVDLRRHLAALKSEDLISPWDQGLVRAGEERRKRVEEQLRAARVIVLLISAAYMASNDTNQCEMQLALDCRRKNKSLLIPVLARKCDWGGVPIEGLRPLPRNGCPVTSWQNQDEAWTDVVSGIREEVERLLASRAMRATLPRIAGSLLPKGTEDSSSSSAASDVEDRVHDAIRRRQTLLTLGEPTEGVTREIMDLKRLSREGPPHLEGARFEEGRYILLRKIGQGGFAAVWLALDQRERIRVALKILHGSLVGDAVRRGRFLRGARRMAEIHHPAIARVVDIGPDDAERPYFAMEFFEGGDLRQGVLENRVPRPAALPLILRVGAALTAAHETRLIHRDIKPANILLRSTADAALSDFDLVAYKDTTGGTRTGALGTFLYAAPELLDHPQDADASADVYGLAMTAVFVLYGKDLPADVLRNSSSLIESLDVEPTVKSVLKRGTLWEPRRRYRNAGEFCEALGYAAGGDPSAHRRASVAQRNILVWSGVTGTAPETRWLRSSSSGDVVELAGVRRGLWFAQGDHLYELQISRRPIRLLDPAEISSFHENGFKTEGLRQINTSIHDVHLVDALSATRIPLCSSSPEALAAPDCFELHRSILVLGSLPRYVFVQEQDYFFGGGAHGYTGSEFRVLDLETLTFVQPLLDEEQQRICERTKSEVAVRFRAEHEEALWDTSSDPLDPESSLTLLYPIYDELGRLGFRCQFTAGACYAASDGRWGSYTVSIEVDAGEVPHIFTPYERIAAAVARAWPACGIPRERMGWSETSSPAVVAWLASSFDEG